MQDLTAAQGVLEHVAFSKDEFETRQGAPAPDFDDCELLSGSPGGGGTCVFLCSGIPVFFPCGFL